MQSRGNAHAAKVGQASLVPQQLQPQQPQQQPQQPEPHLQQPAASRIERKTPGGINSAAGNANIGSVFAAHICSAAGWTEKGQWPAPSAYLSGPIIPTGTPNNTFKVEVYDLADKLLGTFEGCTLVNKRTAGGGGSEACIEGLRAAIKKSGCLFQKQIVAATPATPLPSSTLKLYVKERAP